MANLQKQIDALTAYFQADCVRPGVLPIALTIEHFITRLDGTPVDYAQLAQVIYSMQGARLKAAGKAKTAIPAE